MKNTNNFFGNTSNFLKIIIMSLILVGCSISGNYKGVISGDNTPSIPKTVIVNTALATVFSGAATDESILIEAVAGVSVGIDAGEISLKIESDGIFVDDSVAITTLGNIKLPIIENTVKIAVNSILAVEDNIITGFSKISEVSVVINTTTTATATVTFFAEGTYVFEDKNTDKTLILNLTGSFDDSKSVIVNTLTTIPTTVASGTAGIASFTMNGFADLTVGTITFNSADKTVAQKNRAVKTAFETMFALTHEGVTITVNDDLTFNIDDTTSFITVTFTPKPGYMFEDTTTSPKTARISFTGNLYDSTHEPPIESDKYIITTPDQLAWLSDRDVTKDIEFGNDIDMNSKTFKGIKTFEGTMDGNGHTIKNLTIDNTSGDAGLILEIPSGATTEIKNLTIDSGSITGFESVGAFVAKSEGVITLTGLTNKASVTGTHSFSLVGGIIGTLMAGSGSFDNVVNSGAIFGRDAGGIISMTSSSSTVTITHAQNTGEILSTGRYNIAGGIIGELKGNSSFNNTVNSGAIFGRDAGGIIGKNESIITLNNVGNSGAITGAVATGGIIAYTAKKVIMNFAYNHKDMKLIDKNDKFGESVITSSYRLDSITEEPSGVSDLTIDEFKDQANFIGWNFTDIWKMGTDYPELK